VFRDASDSPVTPPSGYGKVSCQGCIPDNVCNAKSVRDLYVMSNDTLGKFTVPILFDKKKKIIVNNESSEIIRMLNKEFAEANGTFTKETDLYPPELKSQIDSVNEWVYTYINNGVYECGFASTQAAYDEAVVQLYDHLDKAEQILSKQRYLCSNERITEADVRLFQTLIRFDEVYIVYFKTNCKAIREFPNLLNYMRELYQVW
jgi:putative glutathione S-transferase